MRVNQELCNCSHMKARENFSSRRLAVIHVAIAPLPGTASVTSHSSTANVNNVFATKVPGCPMGAL